MSNIKSPPVFNPDEDDDYSAWKSDVEVLQLFTKEEAKRQGPAVYLSLKGRAREAVRGISIEDLKKDEGVQIILAKLDEIFQSDETTRAYHAFKEFVEYRRSSGESFSTFMVEYEKRYREVTRYKLDLPTVVQAFFLLQAANLSPDLEKLARATAKLEFKDMKDKLQKVFGDSCGKDDEVVPVKQEDCLYTSGRGKFFNKRGVRGGRFAGRGRKKYQDVITSHTGKNSMDVDGNIMRCHVCESTKHFARSCPHRETVEESHVTVHIALLTGKGNAETDRMIVESLGKDILDSACTKTVAGKVWVDEFVNNLDVKAQKQVKCSSWKGFV